LKYMAEQKEKTPYSGLNPEQLADILEPLSEFWESSRYTSEVKNYLFELISGRGIIEQNKEQWG